MSLIDTLFSPFKLNGLQLPNRVVMAPMTRIKSPKGVPGDDVRDYYARRAKGEVGLILSEGTVINRGGASNHPDIPNFHSDEALAGWKNVIDAVHKNGGLMAPQLWHMGMMRKQGTGPYPDTPSDSPSNITHTGKPLGDPPSEKDIDDMVMAYANAAGEAAKLGFDAVELHGAHGYLIDQFFWEIMNVRDDKFGGDQVKRVQFAADVIAECRKQMPADMPLIIRISQWKQQDFSYKIAQTPDEMEAFLTPMVDAGVDCFHCSQRRIWEAEYPDLDGDKGLNFAGWAKKLTGVPTISVGSVGLSGEFVAALGGETSQPAPIDDVLERMERGEFDLLAVGRALLKDPYWSQKIRQGRFDELQSYSKEDEEVLW